MTYVTVRKLSEESGVSPSKLGHLIRSGELKAKWDGQYLVSLEDWEQYGYSLPDASERLRNVRDPALGKGKVQDRKDVGSGGEEPDGGRQVGPGEVRAIRAKLDRLKRAANDRRVQARRKPRGAVA